MWGQVDKAINIRTRQKSIGPEGIGQHLRLCYKALGRRDPVKTVQRPGL